VLVAELERLKEVCEELFKVHDDIRHVVIADREGSVLRVCSRAKHTWPNSLIQETAGVAAAIVFGVFEKTKEYGGDIKHIMVSYERMKLFLLQAKDKLLLVSARRTLPLDAVEAMERLVKSL
jgi:predicted regulator of Ras-like GTPase activity (Roadblock/LC7/MglB family)